MKWMVRTPMLWMCTINIIITIIIITINIIVVFNTIITILKQFRIYRRSGRRDVRPNEQRTPLRHQSEVQITSLGNWTMETADLKHYTGTYVD